MARYDVLVSITYKDSIEIEADSPEEAKKIAEQGGWNQKDQSMDTDPEIEVVGEPTRV